MGLLRVLLALSVVLSHLGGLHGYAIAGGLASVQTFYIISGFYMETILREKYDPRRDLGVFYVSRFMRIYSVYFVCLVLSLVVYAVVYFQGGGLFAYIAQNGGRLGSSAKIWLILVTVMVFGQDVVLFQKLDGSRLVFTPDGNLGPDPGNDLAWKFMAVPQAWSIALELMFYCIVPFLTRARTSVLIAIVAISLTARIGLAVAGYGDDPWIYRFFPFELGLFVYGMLARRFYDAWRDRFTPNLQWSVAIAFIIATCLVQSISDIFGISRSWVVWPYYASALVAIPCLFGMTSRFDTRLAALSYPVYLIHWIVIVAYEAVAPQLIPPAWEPAVQAPLVVLFSLGAGWIIALTVELPVDRLRHAMLRGRLARA